MDKIILMTDTTSDITLEMAQELGIHLIPINIILGDVSYKDRYELGVDEFYDKMSEMDGMPKTSQITVQEHIDEFKKFSDDHSIIYVTIASQASGSHQSAQIAKAEILEENPNADITIMDGKSFSYAYGYWVMEAAKKLNDGASKEDIISFIEEGISKTDVRFVVDTLDYLKKGGRISGAAKLFATVLDIKPILTIENGLVMTVDKIRGLKNAISKAADTAIAESENLDKIVVVHGNDIEKGNMTMEILKSKADIKDISVGVVGPTVGSHTGPGVIGIIYFKK